MISNKISPYHGCFTPSSVHSSNEHPGGLKFSAGGSKFLVKIWVFFEVSDQQSETCSQKLLFKGLVLCRLLQQRFCFWAFYLLQQTNRNQTCRTLSHFNPLGPTIASAKHPQNPQNFLLKQLSRFFHVFFFRFLGYKIAIKHQELLGAKAMAFRGPNPINHPIHPSKIGIIVGPKQHGLLRQKPQKDLHV